MSALKSYAKAARILPMAWLTQAEFPAKSLVKQSFQEAIEELPEATTYEDGLVRSALQGIVDGTDPRGGTFKAQAIYAAAQLHDRVSALAIAPKVKKLKVREGSILHGYCDGLLGDSYGHRLVTQKGAGWINFDYLDGPYQGATKRYHGNIKELAEYLLPDTTHCPADCTLGQD